MTQTSLSKTGWKPEWNRPKRIQNKSLPIIEYKLRHPDASVAVIADMFKRTHHSVYSLLYKHRHRLARPVITDDPFAIGHEIPQIPQQDVAEQSAHEEHMTNTYKPKAYAFREEQLDLVSHGQEILRKEISALNDIIDEQVKMIKELEHQVVGYKAVISYLESHK